MNECLVINQWITDGLPVKMNHGQAGLYQLGKRGSGAADRVNPFDANLTPLDIIATKKDCGLRNLQYFVPIRSFHFFATILRVRARFAL